MTNNINVRKIEQKKQYGDFVMLSQMLGITTDAARMRYQRGDKEVIKAMEIITKNREGLIKAYQRKNQEVK